LELARQPIEIVQDNGRHLLIRQQGQRPIGELKKNKNTFTVSGRLLTRVFLKKTNNVMVPLSQVVNQSRDFLISFTDPRYAYHGGLYRDHNLLNQIEAFLSVFHPVPQLAQCTTEKGENVLTAQSVQFPATSVFGVIHDHITVNDSFLMCDDLGNEWADGIGVCTSPSDLCLSFYVAKHKDVGLSASDFQDVIGQANKNLSHKHPLPDEIQVKVSKWGEIYTGTQIPRLLKGANVAAAAAAINSVVASPTSRFRMCLVVSFISKQELRHALIQLRDNQVGPYQLIQLLWIVTDFISACKTASVVPYIYCCP
jgi:hypothetical protein